MTGLPSPSLSSFSVRVFQPSFNSALPHCPQLTKWAAGAINSQQPWTIQVDEPGDEEKATEKKRKTSDLKVTAKKVVREQERKSSQYI
jgi:hypothetical protein